MNKKEYNNIVFELKDKVFRFARTLLNNSDEAEDITQDIFERLWLKREKASDYNNVESYVIQSTRNLCYDHIKHRKVVLKSESEIKHTSSYVSKEEDEPNNYMGQIKKVIELLPKKQKTIMHLRDIEGYDFDEISEIMGIDVNAIRVNLSRARKAVKEELIKNNQL